MGKCLGMEQLIPRKHLSSLSALEEMENLSDYLRQKNDTLLSDKVVRIIMRKGEGVKPIRTDYI
jgi:hypothetical protein